MNVNALIPSRFGNSANTTPKNLHQELEQLARKVERENAQMGYSRTIAGSKLAQQVLNCIRESDSKVQAADRVLKSKYRLNLEQLQNKLSREEVNCNPRELELTLEALNTTGQIRKLDYGQTPPTYTALWLEA